MSEWIGPENHLSETARECILRNWTECFNEPPIMPPLVAGEGWWCAFVTDRYADVAASLHVIPRPDRSSDLVVNVCTPRRHRRRGHARRALLLAMQAAAYYRRDLELELYADNEGAGRLYASLGFEMVGRADLPDASRPALTMRWYRPTREPPRAP